MTWQPDVRTLEWLKREFEWELGNEWDDGPVTTVWVVPKWLARVIKDKERQAKSRWTRDGKRAKAPSEVANRD